MTDDSSKCVSEDFLKKTKPAHKKDKDIKRPKVYIFTPDKLITSPMALVYTKKQMLSIAHGPSGAFIASKIGNPFISLPLAVFVHYLQDRVPHWDVGQGLTHGLKRKSHSFLQELLIDFPLSIIITYFLFQYGKDFNLSIWLGWFAGLLPDFIEFPRLFLKHNHKLIEWHHKFHKWFHVSIPDKFWGLLPQIATLLAIAYFK